MITLNNYKLAFIIIVLVSMSGCANNGQEKEGFGTLLGGIGGAVAGAQFGKGDGQLVATAAGALFGAFIGNQVGQSLDKADLLYAQRAQKKALEFTPSGQATTWINPDSQHQGTFTPTNTYQNATGEYCREYTQEVIIGGNKEVAYGKACRKPDGSWEIAS